MSPKQKQALRFAYRLLQGHFDGIHLAYIHDPIPRLNVNNPDLKPIHRRWIEPDRDPKRPYLNEATLSHLVVKGYFDCQMSRGVWVYSLSRVGCHAMGWQWPLQLPYKLVATRKPNRRLTENLRSTQRDWRNSYTKRFTDQYFSNRPTRSNAWRKR